MITNACHLDPTEWWGPFWRRKVHFESRCGGSDGNLREFQMFYMFSHADDQNAGNGKNKNHHPGEGFIYCR